MSNQNDVNVRKVSFGIVTSVVEDGVFLNDALNNTLVKYQYLDKQKRGYITYLCTGVIERLIEMDAVISAYSSTKINKLNPNIKNILRMAIFEIKYMDSVPESATVNEYVKLSGKVAPTRLKGFVNGMLRTMIRDDFAKVHLKPYEEYSMPRWLYERLDLEFGNANAISEAFLDNRGLTIRTNLTKCTPDELRDILNKEGIKVTSIDLIDYAFSVKGIDYLEKLDSFKKGLFYVQDVSSMMVGVMSKVTANDTVIDVCAAPGGKSLHIAELMKLAAQGTVSDTKSDADMGKVMAYDISEDKVRLIRDNIRRSGLDNVTAKVGDALINNNDLNKKADIVIADLPCSGIGVIGKKPDIKIRIKNEDIDNLAKLQFEILQNVKEYVKPGGKMLYSTCTVSKSENELNTRRFLEANPGFTLKEEKQYMPTATQDGFYIAVLKREA